MVGIGTDNASVMVGINNSLVEQLKREHGLKRLILIHCELATLVRYWFVNSSVDLCFPRCVHVTFVLKVLSRTKVNSHASHHSWTDGFTKVINKPLSKGNRSVIVHVGGETGFVPNAMLTFKDGQATSVKQYFTPFSVFPLFKRPSSFNLSCAHAVERDSCIIKAQIDRQICWYRKASGSEAEDVSENFVSKQSDHNSVPEESVSEDEELEIHQVT
ncbi:hypothetical protein EVAR_47137_1 [Eumeta japonica]|uniref:Uncharacterized protein n=1 Tax=Eumeta variegata TaxID=151549 RepID=A0A4C1XV41_EUMVA|nr:hypothetical protein EVAR_47137_1 [Eumeta japonica]